MQERSRGARLGQVAHFLVVGSVVRMPESPVSAAFHCLAEQVIATLLKRESTMNTHIPEDQKELGATKEVLFGDERED